MSDLISRQDAIEAVIELWANKPFGNPALTEIKECLEDLPFAELPIKEKCCVCPHCDNCDVNKDGTIEQKKGEWIKDELGTTVCSICKKPRRDNRVDHIYYCNSCGADMRGEQE